MQFNFRKDARRGYGQLAPAIVLLQNEFFPG
jgi:hypothetical protein